MLRISINLTTNAVNQQAISPSTFTVTFCKDKKTQKNKEPMMKIKNTIISNLVNDVSFKLTTGVVGLQESQIKNDVLMT